MKRKAIGTLVVVLVLYFAAGYVTWRWVPEKSADFFLRWVMTLVIFGAVFAALFGEYFREKIFPIDLCIEIPQKGNVGFDEGIINGQPVKFYFHHLLVRNLSPHRVIKDCRVWLRKVFVQNAAGEWEPKNQSPVPRLMEWAPSEYSRDKRTFSTWQVFDFGMTLSNNGGFVVSADREQGGNFSRIFPVGKKVRFTFFVTADNYQEETEFSFDVDVVQTVPGETVTPPRLHLTRFHFWMALSRNAAVPRCRGSKDLVQFLKVNDTR